jgi:hypothetical protein
MATTTMAGTTAQVRPWPAGGSWNTVTLNAAGLAQKSQTWGTTLRPGTTGQAMNAVNQFFNLGAGTSDRLAQETAHGAGIELRNDATIATAVTTDGVSTNVLDRGETTGVATVTFVTTVGATPSVTVQIEGSLDNSAWSPLSTADSATPTVFSSATFTITTATTTVRIVNPSSAARYIRVTLSATTNVTSTIDVAVN